MENSITEVVVAFWLEPYLLPKPKKSYSASKTFHTEVMTSAFTDAYRDRGIISWNGQRSCRVAVNLLTMAGTTGNKRISVYTVDWRLEATLLEFSPTPNIAKKIILKR